MALESLLSENVMEGRGHSGAVNTFSSTHMAREPNLQGDCYFVHVVAILVEQTGAAVVVSQESSY